MVSVQAFALSVETLCENPCLLASVDELRPRFCPGCLQPASEPNKPMQIVGHGTYERQVLGLVATCKQLLLRVRRYLCRACGHTISVMPDEVYPGRWYVASAILIALVQHLLCGMRAVAVRDRLGASGETAGWKTLRRWRRALFSGLWGGLGMELGFVGEARDRAAGMVRLRRLLTYKGQSKTSHEESLSQAARELTHVRWGVAADPG